MPYTYMPFLLSALPDEEAYSYIVEVPKSETEEQKPDWEMYAGEVYRLPFYATGIFTWQSSDESVASIDDKGMLVGKSAGDSVLTLKTPSGKEARVRIRVLSA